MASGAPGLPNTTRRPLRRSTRGDPQAAVEARAGALDRLRSRLRSSRGRGDPPQHRRAHQRSARRGHPERQRRERRRRRPARTRRRAWRRTAPPTRARRRARSPPRSLETRRCRCWTAGAATARGQVRGTIEPAEVPTKCSHSRRSKPVASSIPASTPIIHASPRTPPPPSTSTSGGVIIAMRLAVRSALARWFGRRATTKRRHLGPGVAVKGDASGAGQGAVRDNVRLYDGDRIRLDASPRAESLGARVRALREAMDLSLRDLAERSGVSAPMLSQVERGETSPTLQVARRIAAGLELRLSQLLRLDEDGAVTIVRRDERRKGPGRVERAQLRDPDAAAAGPASRALAPHAGRGSRHRRPRRPADARARQPRDGAGRVRHRGAASATASATSSRPATA